MNTENHEPFNLERAKAGEPILYRGRPAEFKFVSSKGEIVIDLGPISKELGGAIAIAPLNIDSSLRMAPRPTVKKTVWVGRYRDPDGLWYLSNIGHYGSMEVCEKLCGQRDDGFIEAVAIEITEPSPVPKKKRTAEIPVWVHPTTVATFDCDPTTVGAFEVVAGGSAPNAKLVLEVDHE